jgi:hypothetical protein
MIKARPSGATVLVSFGLPAEVSAITVSVCGDFNDWSPVANPLTRDERGHFRADIELAAGRRWHFRYLLDGERWENDWAADDYAANVHGGEDSVVDLTGISNLPTVEAAPESEVTSQAARDAGAGLAAIANPRRVRAPATETRGPKREVLSQKLTSAASGTVETAHAARPSHRRATPTPARRARPSDQAPESGSEVGTTDTLKTPRTT